MNLVIDTCAYSALRRRHTGILAVLRRSERVLLSPVVIGELRTGFRGGSQEPDNIALLSEFIAQPSAKLVSVDHETAERFAEIQHYLRKQGNPLPTNDVWIAASAMQYGCRVLTTDQHFLEIPQILTEFIPAT